MASLRALDLGRPSFHFGGWTLLVGAATRGAARHAAVRRPRRADLPSLLRGGLENGIAFDADTGRSRSALFLRTSADGLRWRWARDEPVVAPDPAIGWRRRYAYACDVRTDPATGRWYLYFNGRDHAAMRAVGFVVGAPSKA